MAEHLVLLDPREAMASYSKVIVISEFTHRWLRNWWGIGGQVVYPPCRNYAAERARDCQNDKVILTVGRFFAPKPDNHHKRHDVLIDAFALLSRIVDGYELHLVGSCAPDEATQRYVESLRERAHGLPVQFHLDADHETLVELYQRARLYWHATGYDNTPGTHPEREEHFGITTVEAMSAGAVPIVVPGGGQPEIVVDGVNGYHWRSIRELVDRSTELISDDERWHAMSLRAQTSAAAFSPEHFREAFLRECQRVIP
jgi:glycosyltransferase involved in cell wall biosynthesis